MIDSEEAGHIVLLFVFWLFVFFFDNVFVEEIGFLNVQIFLEIFLTHLCHQ